MNRHFYLFLIFFFGFLFLSEGQNNRYVDSLENILKIQDEDTNKVLLLNDLAWEYSSTDLKKARNYCNNACQLATKIKYIKGRSSAYNTLGNIASDEGKNNEALDFYLLALKDKETIKDKKGIATINSNIGIIYRTKGDLKKALSYYSNALTIRQLLNNKQGIADCYNNIANVYKDQLRFDEAIDYMEKSIKIKSEIGDKRGIGFTYNNIATVYDDKSDFTLALQYHYKAAKILEELNDVNALIAIYNNIGVLNKKLKNYADAIKYSKMALEKAERVGNKAYCINIYENLGAVYLDLKNHKESRLNFEKGLSLAIETNSKDLEARFYEGLGSYYENINDFKNAELNFKHAVQIAEVLDNPRDVARYAYDIGAFYSIRNENELAKKFLDQSIDICKRNGLKSDLKKAYKAYASLYEINLNDLKKSIAYYKLYNELNDSLFSENIAQKFTQQQTIYETEKKEVEIKLLKQQEEINSLQLREEKLTVQKRNYLLAGSGIFILALMFGGYFYFSKQKIKLLQKQEQVVRETEESERLRLAKDIHDDLGSGLSKIKFLTELVLIKSANNPEVKSNIKSIAETAVFLVENMRDLIWALNPENTKLENLIARIREYSSDYLADFPIELITNINEEIPDKEITKEAHRNIFFIVKESLQNIVKHADASVVKIIIDVIGDEFKLSIVDNGKGLLNSDNKKGNGLKNIKQRAEVINSLIEINSTPNNGTSISIIVPIKNIEKT